MEKQHAVLSASSSHRWLTCPPLARLEECFENKINEVSKEGTLAHKVAEEKLKKELGLKYELIKIEDKEMEDYTDDYVSFVYRRVRNIKRTYKKSNYSY